MFQGASHRENKVYYKLSFKDWKYQTEFDWRRFTTENEMAHMPLQASRGCKMQKSSTRQWTMPPDYAASPNHAYLNKQWSPRLSILCLLVDHLRKILIQWKRLLRMLRTYTGPQLFCDFHGVANYSWKHGQHGLWSTWTEIMRDARNF